MMMTIDHWIEMSHLLQVYKIRLDFITLSLRLRFLSVCSVCIMYMVWAGGGCTPPPIPLDPSLHAEDVCMPDDVCLPCISACKGCLHAKDVCMRRMSVCHSCIPKDVCMRRMSVRMSPCEGCLHAKDVCIPKDVCMLNDACLHVCMQKDVCMQRMSACEGRLHAKDVCLQRMFVCMSACKGCLHSEGCLYAG